MEKKRIYIPVSAQHDDETANAIEWMKSMKDSDQFEPVMLFEGNLWSKRFFEMTYREFKLSWDMTIDSVVMTFRKGRNNG